MIEASGLSKYYGNHQAIEDVAFQIGKGEIVGLLGLNGAGKSTILKILGCFLLPSRGSATVGGFSVDTDPQSIRRIIGYLPDKPPLYDEMTVQDYLQFVAKLKDVPGGQLRELTAEAIAKANLEEVMDQRLGALSHGYRQRVGIAQAIVHKPQVLILDEPINGLDPVQIVEMRDLILSLRGDHTVVLSSHILSEMTKTCDRILIIDQGRLVAEGSEEELQGKVSGSSNLVVEVADYDADLKDQLLRVAGVNGVSETSPEVMGAGTYLTIAVESDCRAEIAKCVVQSGKGLLAMRQAEAGLESVFMKMIQGTGGGEQPHG